MQDKDEIIEQLRKECENWKKIYDIHYELRKSEEKKHEEEINQLNEQIKAQKVQIETLSEDNYYLANKVENLENKYKELEMDRF